MAEDQTPDRSGIFSQQRHSFYYYPKQTKSAQQKTIQIYHILIYLNSLISTIGKDIDTSVQIDTKKYDYHLFEFEEKSEKI